MKILNQKYKQMNNIFFKENLKIKNRWKEADLSLKFKFKCLNPKKVEKLRLKFSTPTFI